MGRGAVVLPIKRPSRKDVAVGIIKAYQIFVSPLFGPTCRFYPSCSSYAIESIRVYGLLRGILRAVKRILKCHPLHPGGYDPVQ